MKKLLFVRRVKHFFKRYSIRPLLLLRKSFALTASTSFKIIALQALSFATMIMLGSFSLHASPPYFPETPHLNPDLTNASGDLIFSNTVSEFTKAEMRSDLHTLFVIRASKGSPLQKEIFKGFGGKAYQRYFLSLVDRIEYDGAEDSGAIAYVGYDLFKLYITPYYLNSKMPLIARLSILIHEARHSDDSNDGWRHEICPLPFNNPDGQPIKSSFTGLKLEGIDACDSTELGAYGTAAVFLKNVELYCENCSEKVKMDSAYFARDVISRVIQPEAHARLEKDLAKP